MPTSLAALAAHCGACVASVSAVIAWMVSGHVSGCGRWHGRGLMSWLTARSISWRKAGTRRRFSGLWHRCFSYKHRESLRGGLKGRLPAWLCSLWYWCFSHKHSKSLRRGLDGRQTGWPSSLWHCCFSNEHRKSCRGGLLSRLASRRRADLVDIPAAVAVVLALWIAVAR